MESYMAIKLMTVYYTHFICIFGCTAFSIGYINQVNKIRGLIIIWETSKGTGLFTGSYNTFEVQEPTETIYIDRTYKSKKSFYPNCLSKRLITSKSSAICYICKKAGC